jgi:proteasome alpha subunit
VEYAIETVRRGSLAVGIKGKNSVILAADEKSRKLQVSDAKKLFKIDDHIGVTAAGYIPDARAQVDQARFFAQSSRLIYDEPADVEAVARNIADSALQFTQFAGARPYAVALIIAGVDKNGACIFQTDPSGTYIPYDAIAIGSGSEEVNKFLENNYHTEMSTEDASILALDSIYSIREENTEDRHVSMAQIDTNTRKIKFIQQDDIQVYATKSTENSGERAQQ